MVCVGWGRIMFGQEDEGEMKNFNEIRNGGSVVTVKTRQRKTHRGKVQSIGQREKALNKMYTNNEGLLAGKRTLKKIVVTHDGCSSRE